MLSAQRNDIRRVADLVKELECASDLRVLLANSLNWNLSIADRASGRTADGRGYLRRRERISCDLDGFAQILVRVLERQRRERANVIGGDQPDRYVRLECDCERAAWHAVTRTEQVVHEQAWT